MAFSPTLVPTYLRESAVFFSFSLQTAFLTLKLLHGAQTIVGQNGNQADRSFNVGCEERILRRTERLDLTPQEKGLESLEFQSLELGFLCSTDNFSVLHRMTRLDTDLCF